MLELGQPIHGYDLDKLTGGITVRRAPPGEKLETLDGKVRTLDPEDLLITDGSGPIGLAGVMGGGTTEMGRRTRNVLVEAATFDPISIARTARRHKLPSEASRRFERGVDPPRRRRGRAASWTDGRVRRRHARRRSAARSSRRFVRPRDRAARGFVRGLIGVDYTREQIAARCGSSAAALERARDGWLVTPPTLAPRPHRQVDARRGGRPHRGLRPHPVGAAARRRRAAGSPPRSRAAAASSNALAAAGFVETPSFPFTTEEQNDLHGSASGGHLPSVKLANPLDGQAPFLRRSLVPGLLEIAHRNVSRGFTDLALFESGTRVPSRARRRVRHDRSCRRWRCDRMPRPSPRSTRHPAAAPACRRAARRQPRRRSSPARPRCRRPRRRAGRRAHDRRRRGGRRSTSSRASAPRCTPAAPACSRSAATRGRVRRGAAARGGRGRRPARSRDRGRARPRSRARRSRARRSSPRRCRASPPRRRTCRSSWARTCPPARCAPRSSRVRASCSSRCGSSTTTAGRACRGREEPHVRAALPGARPHADGGRGDRGEARRRRGRGRAVRGDAAGVVELSRSLAVGERALRGSPRSSSIASAMSSSSMLPKPTTSDGTAFASLDRELAHRHESPSSASASASTIARSSAPGGSASTPWNPADRPVRARPRAPPAR